MNPEKHIPSILLPGSKSISNRLLMIKTIGGLTFEIDNLSDSDDTCLLKKALDAITSGKAELDIKHAGTDMRFLCSYLSTIENKTFILTGSERMKERPIRDLVDALKQIGAEISYLENEGYPPLKILGKKLKGNEITVNASVSSQFITSLLLIAPILENGLRLKLEGETVSSSYIKLTIELMRAFGINIKWEGNIISVEKGKYKTSESTTFNESDWSAAGYFYSVLALGNNNSIELIGLNKSGIQPDSKIAEIFKQFGIQTEYRKNKVVLTKTKPLVTHFSFDFTDCPDLAQTIAVTCLGLGIKAELNGLQTLKLKETDRILALKTEMEKFGAKIEIDNASLKIKDIIPQPKSLSVEVHTYHDHRMAMSFAPLNFIYPEITIENKEVVSKSFPKFWNEFSKIN